MFKDSQMEILAVHHYLKWQNHGNISCLATDCICLCLLHFQGANCFESLPVSCFQHGVPVGRHISINRVNSKQQSPVGSGFTVCNAGTKDVLLEF